MSDYFSCISCWASAHLRSRPDGSVGSNEDDDVIDVDEALHESDPIS